MGALHTSEDSWQVQSMHRHFIDGCTAAQIVSEEKWGVWCRVDGKGGCHARIHCDSQRVAGQSRDSYETLWWELYATALKWATYWQQQNGRLLSPCCISHCWLSFSFTIFKRRGLPEWPQSIKAWLIKAWVKESYLMTHEAFYCIRKSVT